MDQNEIKNDSPGRIRDLKLEGVVFVGRGFGGRLEEAPNELEAKP